MKRAAIVLAGLLAAALLAGAALYARGVRDDPGTGPAAPPLLASSFPPSSTPSSFPSSAQERIELGRYLARAANCAACHTVPGGQAYAGGTAIPTDFGTFYGPNITPSREHGIGGWSTDDFWQALHNGKAPDGALLYPAFPYTEYTRMTRADADAIYAYLMSQPASDARSRPHELRFPYDRRALLGLWRGLYFDPGVMADEPGQDAQWNRGRYLVEGAGHCAACHTPRNRWGASDTGRALQGAPLGALGWYATPLTGEAAGLGGWSEDDVAQLLRTGWSRHGAAGGPMAEVVAGSTQHLSDADLRAMAAYLKSLPAGSEPAGEAAPPPQPLMERGSRLYEQSCAACHQASGEGSPGAWPALAGNPSVTAASSRNVLQAILRGGYAPATAADPRPHGMPPFHTLDDADVAALATYVRNSWGNRAGAVQPHEVARMR